VQVNRIRGGKGKHYKWYHKISKNN
jgi:hypothetical protein